MYISACIVHTIQIMDPWLFGQRVELDRSDHYSLLSDCIGLSTIPRRIRFYHVKVRCGFWLCIHWYDTLFAHHTFLLRIFMSIVFMLCCIRILHLFAASKSLGPKLLMIRKMVTDRSVTYDAHSIFVLDARCFVDLCVFHTDLSLRIFDHGLVSFVD